MKRKFLCLSAIILTATSLNSFAALGAGWEKNSVGWWYSKDNGGYYRNEWMLDVNSGLYYYFNNAGYMVSGQWIGNYYIGRDGAMLTNSITPDGYYVGSDGAWIPDTFNLSGYRGDVLLFMSEGDNKAGVYGNTWKISGEWNKYGEGNGAMLYSTQELNADGNTKYFSVQEGTAAEIPISRNEFERRLTDRTLEYMGFRFELNNKTIVKAFVYD